jgi:solute:Na+ symporter, SSS family
VIWGLSYLDFAIVLAFLVLVLGIGLHASRSVKHAADFYLGGRKLGRTLQFFLNFGNATDTNAAPTMASQVFQQGASGIWLQLQTLLFTPLYWFTQPWFRRARVTTMADLFIDRFRSPACASAYALFNVMVALITLGLGNLGGYSVAEAMMVKDPQFHTQQEAAEVAGAQRLADLNKMDAASRTPAQKAEKADLLARKAAGKLRSQIGAISKLEFYVGYNAIIAIFIMLGGLKAAALTDAVQGILILFMSLILLPVGLYFVGGFSGLHARIGDPTKFLLTGTQFTNFTWYSIAAFTFTSFIQIIGLQHNMSAAGSATNENAARFGMLAGGFLKRLILICWMLCGFLGLALLAGKLDNPDYAWGALSKTLLPVGVSGVMLAGMLLGHMPAVGLTAVAVSGLVVRNLYTPLFRDRSAKHYFRVGQLVVLLVLAVSIAIAWNASNLGSLTQKMILTNTFFGAVLLLLFFWRRLTVPAILISFVLWLAIQIFAPLAVGFTSLQSSAALTLKSLPPQVTIECQATPDDVAAGLAPSAGVIIKAPFTPQPSVMFFDALKFSEGQAPRGSFFIAENYLVYRALLAVGIDMRYWSAAQINTARYLFDGLFPFVCLIGFSLLTKPSAPQLAAPFYAKMKTPVDLTPEQDQERVQQNQADPWRVEHLKLLPGSNWEFAKWTRQDFLGFFGCCAIALAILGVLYLVLHLGQPGGRAQGVFGQVAPAAFE